jgi:UTP:GlnB (protein PII) uridylyltransferase
VLHNAKINTLGGRAEDMFLISARSNQRLDDKLIEQLQQSLLKNI